MTEMICYCFGYTEDDLVKDMLANKGVSTILKRIAAEKQAGGCRCGTRNPHGR